MLKKQLVALSLFALIAFAAVGCGPKTVPVSGKITVDGAPAQNIRVVFQSASTGAEVAPVATGLTDEKGEFSLKLAERKKRGAVAGPYAVFLTWSDPEAADNPVEGETEAAADPYKLPPRANSGELRFEVPAGGTNEANFEFNTQEESYQPVGV